MNGGAGTEYEFFPTGRNAPADRSAEIQTKYISLYGLPYADRRLETSLGKEHHEHQVSVTPLSGLLTTELGYTSAWDDEHTLGARFQLGKFVELCGSVLPP